MFVTMRNNCMCIEMFTKIICNKKKLTPWDTFSEAFVGTTDVAVGVKKSTGALGSLTIKEMLMQLIKKDIRILKIY